MDGVDSETKEHFAEIYSEGEKVYGRRFIDDIVFDELYAKRSGRSKTGSACKRNNRPYKTSVHFQNIVVDGPLHCIGTGIAGNYLNNFRTLYGSPIYSIDKCL